MWKLIQQFADGSISPQDRLKLEQWMDQDSSNEQLVTEVKQIWELTPEENFNVNVQDAWERFYHRKMQDNVNNVSASEIQKKFRKTIYIYRAAAVFLVVLLTGFFVQYYATNSSDAEKTAQFYVMQDLTTEKGEKARVTFSDGTQVILNAASTLQFPKEFQGLNREVYLDGEAYFKVAHDSEHSFVVHTRNAKVQVLGTEFNIRGWDEDSSVDVAVRNGKVAVNSSESLQQNSSEVILTQGQFTSVKKGENPIPAQEVNVENYLLWTNGGLHFDNVSFSGVVKQLERKFDVQISVADSGIMDVPFTSTFRQAEISEVLKVIAASMKMEYTRDGSKIVFKKM